MLGYKSFSLPDASCYRYRLQSEAPAQSDSRCTSRAGSRDLGRGRGSGAIFLDLAVQTTGENGYLVPLTTVLNDSSERWTWGPPISTTLCDPRLTRAGR
eukprot:8046115-Pyramimonas_sp.AAC.1